MKKAGFILFLSLSFVISKAQDPIFSQFYANPVYLNPSLNGYSETTKLSSNYRKQWAKNATTFNTFSSTIEHPIHKTNSAIGFQFIKDVAGDNIFNNTAFSFVYSYVFKINQNWQIRSGIQAGVAQRSINSNNLIFEDQLDVRNGVVRSSEERLSNETKYYPDFSAGLNIMSKKAYFGLAIHHLNQPRISFNEHQKEQLEQKYTLHGGLKIEGKNSIHDYFSPNIIFQQQGASKTLSIGSYFKRKTLIAGTWYRVNQAVDFLIGAELEQFKLGYSSDFSVNKYSNRGLSHELSLTILINKMSSKRLKRKDLVFCPTF